MNKILIVRHALAQDREKFSETGHKDSKRPLTREGIKKMKEVAKSLKLLLPNLSWIVTSPYTRANQTAEILSNSFKKSVIKSTKNLHPERSYKDIIEWLAKQPHPEQLALVGHEPHLGSLIGGLLTGKSNISLPLKKSGVCLLSFENDIKPGQAQLEWFSTPSSLKKIVS